MIGTQPYSSYSCSLVLEAWVAAVAATVIHRCLPWFPSPSVSFIIASRATAATVSFWSRRRNHCRRKVLNHAYQIFLSVIHYWVLHFFIRISLLHSGYFYPQFRTGFRIILSAVGHLSSGYFYPQLWKNGLRIFLSTRGIWLADKLFRSVVVVLRIWLSVLVLGSLGHLASMEFFICFLYYMCYNFLYMCNLLFCSSKQNFTQQRTSFTSPYNIFQSEEDKGMMDFKKFVGCQSQLIGCRKQLPTYTSAEMLIKCGYFTFTNAAISAHSCKLEKYKCSYRAAFVNAIYECGYLK